MKASNAVEDVVVEEDGIVDDEATGKIDDNVKVEDEGGGELEVNGGRSTRSKGAPKASSPLSRMAKEEI